MKDVVFVGSSLDDLRRFARDAKHDMGQQLAMIQRGLNLIGLASSQVSMLDLIPSGGNFLMNTRGYSDVWDAVAETPAEAANVKIRSRPMIVLAEYVARQEITQVEAAKRFGVPRSRVSELMNGRIRKFSIDRLVNMAARVNLETHIVVNQSSGQPWISPDDDVRASKAEAGIR